MGNSIGKILDYVFVPRICYRPRLSSIMAGLSHDEREIVMDRVAYYNKLQEMKQLLLGNISSRLRRSSLAIRRVVSLLISLTSIVS